MRSYSRRSRKPKKTELNDNLSPKEISVSTEVNIKAIQVAFHNTSDLKTEKLDEAIVLVYIETLADSEKISEKILLPAKRSEAEQERMIEKSLTSHDLNEGIQALLKGQTLLFIEGEPSVRLIDTPSTNQRQIQEPANEKVIRGSHEGFIESLQVNINLIRKKIEDENLCVHYYQFGKKTKTNYALVYMDNLVNPIVLDLVQKRLDSISADTIISPGFVEEFIEDNPFSPFPQTLKTERPDRTIANIMEGRVALVSEDSPSALIMPVTFFAFYQTPDDYNSRWITGSFSRLIRMFSFIIAIGLPAFYIAIAAFHFEVIPDELVVPLKATVTGIPYPPFIEALFMVLTIELIREAGIRLPTPVGQTIGIVGGLVIGNAVVMAGLISNIMIIIIALTAIASFVVPSNEMSTTMRILTFPLILAAATFGFVGIVFVLMFLLIHMCKLESYGTPYFAPVSPFRWRDLKDTFVRFPIWLMNYRPADAHSTNRAREWNSRGWNNDKSRK